MRIKFMVFLSLFLFACASWGVSGPEAGITGTVVDAETGEPVEGAVVYMEWHRTRGLPGMTYTRTYKRVEALTGRDGRFAVSKKGARLFYPSFMVVLKRGYVAWRNDDIFPNYEKRAFTWSDNLGTIRLERWQEEYSHERHYYFIGTGVSPDIDTAPTFNEIRTEERRKGQNRRN